MNAAMRSTISLASWRSTKPSPFGSFCSQRDFMRSSASSLLILPSPSLSCFMTSVTVGILNGGPDLGAPPAGPPLVFGASPAAGLSSVATFFSPLSSPVEPFFGALASVFSAAPPNFFFGSVSGAPVRGSSLRASSTTARGLSSTTSPSLRPSLISNSLSLVMPTTNGRRSNLLSPVTTQA